MKRYFVFRIRKHFGRTRRKEQNRSFSFTISVFIIRTFGNKSCVEIHPKKCKFSQTNRTRRTTCELFRIRLSLKFSTFDLTSFLFF